VVIVVQFFQCPGNPAEQAGLDLASVDLVQHLVSTARIKIEGDVAQPGIAVAANQCVESGHGDNSRQPARRTPTLVGHPPNIRDWENRGGAK
jgi:hypothetical protein